MKHFWERGSQRADTTSVLRYESRSCCSAFLTVNNKSKFKGVIEPSICEPVLCNGLRRGTTKGRWSCRLQLYSSNDVSRVKVNCERSSVRPPPPRGGRGGGARPPKRSSVSPANVRIVPHLGHDRFLPNPSQFISHPTILCYVALVLKASLNNAC
jgi:hypothetical protein